MLSSVPNCRVDEVVAGDDRLSVPGATSHSTRNNLAYIFLVLPYHDLHQERCSTSLTNMELEVIVRMVRAYNRTRTATKEKPALCL